MNRRTFLFASLGAAVAKAAPVPVNLPRIDDPLPDLVTVVDTYIRQGADWYYFRRLWCNGEELRGGSEGWKVYPFIEEVWQIEEPKEAA